MGAVNGFQQLPFADIDANLGFRACMQHRLELFQPRRREQCGDDGVPARQQPLDHLDIGGHQHAGSLMFLDAAEGVIQRQFRRIERLNGLDVQIRHTGIKPRNRGKAKREGAEPLTRISRISTN